MLHAFYTRDANAEWLQIEFTTLKYNGLEEPEAWLDDYLTAVKFQRGTNVTGIQYV